MQKPSAYPEFALVDVNNGPNGEANTNEPSVAKKSDGWDWGEFPPRETFNWLHRNYYQWIKYREERSNEVDSYFTNQW